MPFHGRSGEKITHKVRAEDDADRIARRLTMQSIGW